MESLFWHQSQPWWIHEAKRDNSWEFPANSNEDDSSIRNYHESENSTKAITLPIVLEPERTAHSSFPRDWTIWKGQLHICFQSSKTRGFQTKYAECSCWKPLLPIDTSPVQFWNHFITVIDILDPRTIDWACTWTKSVHVRGGLAFHLLTAPPLSLAGKSMKHLHVKT